MRWDQGHESDDVIDRRGQGGGGPNLAGGAGLLFFLLRFKYGWVAVLAIVGYVAFRSLSGGSGTATKATTTTTGAQHLAQNDTQAHFVAFVLDDAQQFWAKDFEARGREYRNAKLVLFTNSTDTGCGGGSAATGPFYCPNDERVYIDLGFFDTLQQQLGAKGEFARAYVVAHELGHHVQDLLGIEKHARSGVMKGASGNSVRLELQADCYAGVWAHSAQARSLLETGDIESAINAASRIGDDVLQREETGRVRPESFTHGTAQQRERWLERGFSTGDITQCDTFSAPTL
jgi:predicted metalloprotease